MELSQIKAILDDAIGESGEFGMFTPEADTAVAEMVKQALALPVAEQGDFLDAEIERIACEHSEIYDTMVRDLIGERFPHLDL